MEIVKQIDVRSADAKWIFEQKINSGVPVVTIAVIKLSKVYELSIKQCLYACMAMSGLVEKIYKVKTKMLKLIEDFETLIDAQKIKIEKIDIKVLGVYELHVSDPIVGDLINILEVYDRLSCILSIANRLNVFKGNRHKYFKAVNNNRGRIYSILLDILDINLSELSTVSLTQYLNKEEAYLKASKTQGEVRPASLYAVLNMDIFPRHHAAIRNTILSKLKQME